MKNTNNNFFKIKLNYVCIAISIALVLILFRITSGYSNIQVVPAQGSGDESAIQNLPSDIKCVPGADNGAYYTRDLTPGGICGDQMYVVAAGGYTITDGIGGPLLTRDDTEDDKLAPF